MEAEQIRVRSGTGSILLGAILAACGGSDSSSTPAPSLSYALADLCERLAEADCARRQQCDRLAPLDEEACVARQASVWCAPTQAALQTAVESGQLAYLESSAPACAQAIRAGACGQAFGESFLSVAECRALFEAQSGDGDPCQVSLACVDGLFCAVDDSCPGTCQAFAQNNESCGLSEPCAPGLFCSLTAMRCRAAVSAGGACEATPTIGNPCVPGFFCDASQPGQSICAEVRGRGEGCRSNFECIPGARCVDNRCSAGIDGDACRDEQDCQPDLQCLSRRCATPVGLNAACTSSVPCGEGLVCTATIGAGSPQICTPLPRTGEPCGADDACYLSRCVNGVCADTVVDGAACADMTDCQPGRRCDGVCRVNPACF